MTANIKSISLSYEEVQGVLERYINEQLLRTLHRIVDIDPCDYDLHNALQFNLHLEPAPAPAPVAVAAPNYDLPLHIGPLHNGAPDGSRAIIDVALELGRNGLIKPIAATQETAAPATTPATTLQPALVQAPAAGRKRPFRIDDATRAEILRLGALGIPASKIAAQLGIGGSTAAHYIAVARQASQADEEPGEE